MNLDGSNVNFFISYIAGFLTFFASCLLPLVPTYIAYISGISLKDNKKKFDIFLSGLFFTLGFIFIFMLLGFSASSFGIFFARHKNLIKTIGGIYFILLGFFMLNIVSPKFLLNEKRISLKSNFHKIRVLNAFLIGLTFGFAWSPCIGPVLSVILFWSSQTRTVMRGVFLLFSYGLGLGTPFVLISLFFEKINFKKLNSLKFGKYIRIISGIIILLAGFLLIFGKLHHINQKIVDFLNISSITL